LTRIRIENVVASVSLGSELDLPSLALTLDGAEYDPNQFPGLIYRSKQPSTAVLLFHSGKAVCTGAKSRRQVDASIRAVSELIRRNGQKILKHPKIQVQNIVATSDLECEIDLTSIAVTLGLDRVEYEPEQFPGLVCRLTEPRVVVLFFGSGKLVCTGARRPSDVALAVQRITTELQGAGLLRRERGPTNPVPSRSSRRPRSSTVVPAFPSNDPVPPSEASAIPTALAGPLSPDPPGRYPEVRRVRPSAPEDRVVGSTEERDKARGGGVPPRPAIPGIPGHSRPSATLRVSLGCPS
jgi:transcription initiation factor TFIID TATA-box-binding protein